MVVKKQGSYLEEDGRSDGIRSASRGLTLQLRGGHFYMDAGTHLKTRSQGSRARAMEAAAHENPIFGTRLFVCVENWVLRYSRSLNEPKGPVQGGSHKGRGCCFNFENTLSQYEFLHL